MRGSEWFSLSVFLSTVAIVYVAEASLIIRAIINRFREKPTNLRLLAKPAIFLHCLAFLGVVCFLYGYFVEPYWIEVSTIEIFTEKIDQWHLRIVQISDLHCDKKVRNEDKLVDTINSLDSDIIVFTGDSLNTPHALPNFKEVLKKLNARIGKFAVRGNYDVWYWSRLNLFEGTGFTVLDNEAVFFLKRRARFLYIRFKLRTSS